MGGCGIVHIVFYWSFNVSTLLSGFILNFASTATKKISESVAETAQTIKKTVEESNIDGIIDKVPQN